MIELRRLRAFVAVAEEGHITRAAERLGMQQPPLTRLIQGLETQLDARLLDRTPRGVRVTDVGRALLEEARAVLARAEKVEGAVRRAARGEEGRLSVGFTSSATLHPFFPAALRAFRESAPAVSIGLEEAGTGELVEALLQERLDAAFVRSPIGATPGLTIDDVLDEPMIAALPAGHALASEAGAAIPLRELAGEPFILYRRPAGPGLYAAILAACLAAGFSPQIVQEAPRLTATLSLVAAGLGVSIVPTSLRRLGGDGVVYRPLAEAHGLSAPLRLVTRRATGSPVVVRFRALVRYMVETGDFA